MSDKLGMHCFVSGKVQGVWYRASTKAQADALGLTGWAKNLPDGRVEVLAFGGKQQLATLHAWLQRGPELARVTEVTYEELPYESMSEFLTK